MMGNDNMPSLSDDAVGLFLLAVELLVHPFFQACFAVSSFPVRDDPI
jgi:hypothetical protein